MKKFAMLVLMALAGSGHAAELYNNGPAVGADQLSVKPDTDGTYGYSACCAGEYTVADDFTVSGGSWTITDIDLYAYQTMSNPKFFFHNVSWSIVAGDVNGGTVVASGFNDTTNGGVVGWRVSEADPSSIVRTIYDLKVDIADVVLGAGTYWLTFSINGSENYGGPYVTPTADGRTGNLMGSHYGGPFSALTDSLSGKGYDVPFVLNGTAAAVPEPGTAMAMSGGLLALALRSRRRGGARGAGRGPAVRRPMAALKSRLGRALAGLGCLFAISAAHADVTVYTSQADFLAVTATTGVDTFDGLPLGSISSSPLIGSAGTFGYTATSVVPGQVGNPDVVDSFHAVGSARDVWLTSNDPTATITFSGFASNVDAIGGFFFTSNAAGRYLADQVLQVIATDADGSVTRTVLGSTKSSFLGFVSSTGSLVSLQVLAIQDVVSVWGTVNDLTLGSTVAAVPEPATYGLMAFGLLVVGFAARRRGQR